MKTINKVLVLLTLFFVCCCSQDNTDKGPVDGPYYVTVENIYGEGCKFFTQPEPGIVYTVNVLRRLDEQLNIVFPVVVSGPTLVKNIVINGNSIEYSTTYKPSYISEDTPDYELTISGLITPNKLDLTVLVNTELCDITSIIYGNSRKLGDMKILDGYYTLEVTDYGSVCTGETIPEQRGIISTVNIENTDVSEELRLLLDDGIFIFIPIPSADNNYTVNWTGEFLELRDFWSIERDGSLVGTLSPEIVDLELVYKLVGDDDPCFLHKTIVGKKRIPLETEIDNDYRVHAEVSSDCPEFAEEPEFSFDEVARLTTQLDESIILEFLGQSYDLIWDNGLSYSAEYSLSSRIIRLVADIDPPYLHYKFVVDLTDPECVTTVDVIGLVRYIPLSR